MLKEINIAESKCLFLLKNSIHNNSKMHEQIQVEQVEQVEQVSKLSIVLILKKYTYSRENDYNNLDKFIDINMKYFEKNFDLKCLSEFIIVTAPNELDEISKAITNIYPTTKYPWMFYSEDQLLYKTIPNGPFRDHLIRISIAPLIKTDYYFVINDNSILNKNLLYNDLIINNKPILNKIDIDLPFNYLTSSQLLQLDFDKVQNSPVMGKTPQIFITSIVKDLIKYLIDNYGNQKVWQVILVNNRFNDYALYWSWIVKNNLTEKYCICGPGHSGPKEYFYDLESEKVLSNSEIRKKIEI
jgi:hypothetical protein